MCVSRNGREHALKQDGAAERTRTSDLLITNQLLYQLSYCSLGLERIASWGVAPVRQARTLRLGWESVNAAALQHGQRRGGLGNVRQSLGQTHQRRG